MSDPTADPQRDLADASKALAEAARQLGRLPDATAALARAAATSAGTPTKLVPPSAAQQQAARGLNPAPVRPWVPPQPPGWRHPPQQYAPTYYAPPAAPSQPPPAQQQAAGPGRATKPRRPPKSTLGKLWAAVKPTVARQFGKTAAGRFAKNVSWYGRQGGALGKKVGRALGGAQGAATGAAIGSVAGKLIPIAGAAVTVATGLNEFRKKIQDAADAALESKRKYEEVSGSMAAVFAEQDVKQLMRDMRRGEATAGSTKDLADSVDARKDQFARLETAMDNATNRVLATGQDALNRLLEGPIEVLTTMAEGIDQLVKDFREVNKWLLGEPEKKKAKDDVSTLADISGRLANEGRLAEDRAKAAMDRIRNAGR